MTYVGLSQVKFLLSKSWYLLHIELYCKAFNGYKDIVISCDNNQCLRKADKIYILINFLKPSVVLLLLFNPVPSGRLPDPNIKLLISCDTGDCEEPVHRHTSSA